VGTAEVGRNWVSLENVPSSSPCGAIFESYNKLQEPVASQNLRRGIPIKNFEFVVVGLMEELLDLYLQSDGEFTIGCKRSPTGGMKATLKQKNPDGVLHAILLIIIGVNGTTA
jgi:hypothetical protein